MKNLGLLMMVFMLSSLVFAEANVAKTKPMTGSRPASSYSSPVQESYFAGFEYELQTALSTASLQTYKAGGNTYTVIDGQVSLSKVIKNNIQAGGEIHFNNTSGGNSSSYLEFLGFGVYNLDHDLKQSLYAKGGIGMQNVLNDKGSNEAKVAFMIGGGKRLLVLEKFTYNPEARIVVVDGTTRFQLMLLNFSLLF